MVQLYCGDCLKEMEKVPDHSVDLSVMDPPYNSGGMFRADRSNDTANKYGIKHFKSFSGDNMDQWVLIRYWADVFEHISKKLKSGGGSPLSLSIGET